MDLTDILRIEDGEDTDYTSLQSAINSGTAWSFQGSYGRAMMDAIEAGVCCLGRTGCRDYYGNYIPSRTEVKKGTKGSLAFVRKHSGDAHARRIGRVK